MLELYNNINSVCAQKVRIALSEKKQNVTEHLLTLQGDQNDPEYLKLNPNGVVPTLVHDGNVITESSLILYYIDDAFPEPSLMPKTPIARHRVRAYNKLVDEHVHNSCTIITFADGVPTPLSEDASGAMARGDQQGSFKAAGRVQTQRYRIWVRL